MGIDFQNFNFIRIMIFETLTQVLSFERQDLFHIIIKFDFKFDSLHLYVCFGVVGNY